MGEEIEKNTASDCKRMKYEDLLSCSNVFASEFNNSSLHDRVLVFEVIDGQEVEEEEPSGTEMEEAGENSSSGDAQSLDTQTKKHRIFVHSSWLAVQSPYFRALFYSGMKESFSKEVIMKITENELEAHLTLIEAMYHMEVLDDKDYSLVLQVMVLANKYDIALVFKKCNYILMSISLTLESCQDILQTVKDLPDCADLQNVFEKFLVNEFTPFDQTWNLDKFISLPEASLRLLLSSNGLPVQCENTIFVALMKWIGANLSSKSCCLSRSTLLQLVRFELMTIDFLCDVVRHHPIAKKMKGFNKFLQKGTAYHGFSMVRKQKMGKKPVRRPSCVDKVSTFTWIIDKDEREKLSSSSRIQSCPYWFQGYQMRFHLRYNSDSNSFGLYMHILNIAKKSYLNISWTAKSDLFKNRSVTVNKIYTGTSGLGRAKVESSIRLFDVSEAMSHTIDVSVKFN